MHGVSVMPAGGLLAGMDLSVNLGLMPSLHIHASGALTYCGLGDDLADWDDDAAILSVPA